MKLFTKVIISASILIGLTLASVQAGIREDTTSKGKITVFHSWDMPADKPKFVVQWGFNAQDYHWSTNSDSKGIRVCYQYYSQPFMSICSSNKKFAYPPNELAIDYDDQYNRNFSSGQVYKVSAYGFGKKKVKRFWDNFNPATWYYSWRRLGTVLIDASQSLACTGEIEWWTTPIPVANFDGANCHLGNLTGSFSGAPFVYQDRNWYVPADGPGDCPIGNWDGANCWLGRAPAGYNAFFYGTNRGIYYGAP